VKETLWLHFSLDKRVSFMIIKETFVKK